MALLLREERVSKRRRPFTKEAMNVKETLPRKEAAFREVKFGDGSGLEVEET